MKIGSVKKIVVSLSMAAAFVLSTGFASSSLVQAQNRDWGRGRWENRQDDRRDDWRLRQQERERQEQERLRREREAYRNRNNGTYRDDGYYRNNGRYGRNDGYYGNDGQYGNYGYNNGEVQRGFRDGLDRGQEDARDRDSFNPNNSQHYRNGSAAYREGFQRGYAQGYRQNRRY